MKRINIALGSLMLLGVLFSCSKATLNYTQNGNWVNRATFPGIPSGYSASFVINDQAYLGTGINPLDPNHRLRAMYKYTAEDYDPNKSPTAYANAFGQWSQIADFGGSARSNAVGFTIGNLGYLGTGQADDGFTPLADVWKYDPNTNAWTRIADLGDTATSPRFDAVAWGFASNGYILTGTDNNYYFADVWKYDPGTNKWTKFFFPGSPRSGAVTWVYNGKGYLLTGYTPGSQYAVGTACYDFWRFDPTIPVGSSGVWTRLRDISNTNPDTYDDGYTNIIRTHGVGFVIPGTNSGDKGYLTLGSNGSAYTYTWEYDFASDLWTEKTPYEGPGRSGAVGFTIKKRGFVCNGISGAGTAGSGYSDLREFFPNQIYNQYD